MLSLVEQHGQLAEQFFRSLLNLTSCLRDLICATVMSRVAQNNIPFPGLELNITKINNDIWI